MHQSKVDVWLAHWDSSYCWFLYQNYHIHLYTQILHNGERAAISQTEQNYLSQQFCKCTTSLSTRLQFILLMQFVNFCSSHLTIICTSKPNINIITCCHLQLVYQFILSSRYSTSINFRKFSPLSTPP